MEKKKNAEKIHRDVNKPTKKLYIFQINFSLLHTARQAAASPRTIGTGGVFFDHPRLFPSRQSVMRCWSRAVLAEAEAVIQPSLKAGCHSNNNDDGDDRSDTKHRVGRGCLGEEKEGGGRGGGDPLNQITAQPMKLIADAATAPSSDEWINCSERRATTREGA